ncbi:MAG TPA: SAM-dependent methyltransferase [Pseudonocardiaceae bacterium]|jgi:methyltransferase (TIGR00027 family)|nr:SAM-dependent methyltransferase [Pseudonocardiaceae bacterium]
MKSLPNWWRRPRTEAVSRTSQAVALIRAGLDRPHSPDGDPAAQRGLCVGMRPTPAIDQRPGIVARTGFIDDHLQAALADGVRQVVICGAGYDDRALRFRTPGVRFFELDHPATQSAKKRRYRQMKADTSAIALIPADFRTTQVGAVLAAHGHEPTHPTLYICEGLLVYLSHQTCLTLLTALSVRSAPGSTLVVSLATHPAGADSAQVVAAANARRRAGHTEPWQTILPAADHLDLLRQAGWHPDQTVDAVELAPEATPGRTLLVAALRTRPAEITVVG